ncbi:multidrug resistance-associated protein 5 [Tanacetum coccineum]
MTVLNEISTSQGNVHQNSVIESLPISLIPVEDSEPTQEEIDILLVPDNLIPSGVEDLDSEDEVNESPNLDHQEDPSITRPPPEPPDIKKCVEPKAGIMIIKEFKGVSKSHVFMTGILPTLSTLVSDLPFISSFVSFENENTIFDPGIVTFLEPVASHRDETFIYFHVGEKYVTVEQFKECLTYYALANGFSLWYERSSGKKVVEKCGQRPPRFSVPEKGSMCFLLDWQINGRQGLCRKVIALDGCFLKSPNQGEILTAIGRDENNHIYPIAWAMVNVETKTTAVSFCSCWKKTWVASERGKWANLIGLMKAVKDVMPNAEHKQSSYPQLFNKIMDKIKSANLNAHKFWHGIPAGGNLFEVRSRSEGFTVDEGKKTCSCRMWQLSGIPCVHAIKVIFLINRVPESYVPTWFETDLYFVAYHHFLKPVPGMNFWPDQSMYSIVLPPKPKKMHARPRKKRIGSKGESGSSTRVSKLGSQGSCSNCKKPRHNKASCKEPILEQTPKPKGVPSRPRKKQSVVNIKDVDVNVRGTFRDGSEQGGNSGA